MDKPIVEIKNLSKLYRVGEIGTTTLRETFERWWHRVRGNGNHNGHGALPGTARASKSLIPPEQAGPEPNTFWALRDVNLTVKKGEILGILGRNGAGKSTLLKILSRITEPSSGRAVLRGRVASLLEVGTGFHPELSGRENIFLNGAMLGMTRAEISRKFDEIVDFADIGQFIDTPVKRYSSGMYVRLAFAVAAHLEPEILIVDEVLAVGDAQFQKKCIDKMQNVSRGQGRTVLFVSHNLDAVQRLCTHCVIFNKGRVTDYGDKDAAIAQYLSMVSFMSKPGQWIDLSKMRRQGTGRARFESLRYSSGNQRAALQPFSSGPLEFSFIIESDQARTLNSLAVTIYSSSGTKLVNADTVADGQRFSLKKGRNEFRLKIEQLHLAAGSYLVGLWISDQVIAQEATEIYDFIEGQIEIEVVDLEVGGLGIRSDGLVPCRFGFAQTA